MLHEQVIERVEFAGSNPVLTTKTNKVMNIEDVKLFCKSCNKEIPLTVFQKTGLMGIHNQYESIPEICPQCKEEPNEETIDFKTK